MLDIGKDNIILSSLAKLFEIFRNKDMLCGLTFPELVTCHFVRHNAKVNKSVQAKDLAKAHKVSKPAISKMLNVMEAKGLIAREHRQDNRKAVYIVLTEVGEKVLEEQGATAAVISKRVFAEMGTEKAKEFISLIDCFYDSYQKVVAKDVKTI